MGNTLSKVRLYSPSSIGSILRIARERACQEERRTKRYMAESLGITVSRLTNIEEGFSQIPFEIAIEWCQIVEDDTALEQIKHIYGMDLPATDPRLLESVQDQLSNFIEQATQSIKAAEDLLRLSKDIRPRTGTEKYADIILEKAEEILDVKQAASNVLTSLKMKWKLDTDQLHRNWIQEAIADEVIIPSVSQFENIKKELFFENRFKQIGGKKDESTIIY